MKSGEFFEDDESPAEVARLRRLAEVGRVRLDDVAWDDEQEPALTGPCEFATGATRFNPAPVVELCRRPGVSRRGITWCEVIACDECYARWRGARA